MSFSHPFREELDKLLTAKRKILTCYIAFLQKRSRDEADETSKEHIKLLKDVGHVGKGYVKSVSFLKASKLQG